jgi:putative tryptophan/tyrosine transport system ATP-binding protein
MTAAPMLRLERITKFYFRGTPNAVGALNDLSLDIQPGDFISVIGSNGAGKSTLLRTVAGLVTPDQGRVLLLDRDITREPVYRRARHIGRIAQDPNESTCAIMTIEENLAMAARRGQRRGLRRAVTPARRAEFARLLAEVGLGLEARLAARVGTLSGGQRQALALLMATLARPKLLLLDEHLASLDPKTADLVMVLTNRLVSEHQLTTLMVTHNMAQAVQWGNRVIMMHAGRIILDVAGEEKAALSVADLVGRFHEASQQALSEDRVLLSM